ncbi:MAG: aminotransferase [Clostridia bacterium]
MQEETKVFIKIVDGGKQPVRQSEHSAGYDLYAPIDMVLRPGETKIMPLDFLIAIEPGVEAQVRPRSGLSLKTSLRMANAPGTIDSDYRDLVGVIVENTFDLSNLAYRAYKDEGFRKQLQKDYRQVESLGQKIFLDSYNNPYGTIYIAKGDRIAQMLFAHYLDATFELTQNIDDIGSNRGGGFGHTGK